MRNAQMTDKACGTYSVHSSNKCPSFEKNIYRIYQYSSYIVDVSFIGGGNRSTQRKPPIGRKSLTNFIT